MIAVLFPGVNICITGRNPKLKQAMRSNPKEPKINILIHIHFTLTELAIRAVVVAQLTERLLPLPEGPGSNPVMGNFYLTMIYC